MLFTKLYYQKLNNFPRLTFPQTGESREIVQFQFLSWPDFGTPTTAEGVLTLLKEVRHYQASRLVLEGDSHSLRFLSCHVTMVTRHVTMVTRHVTMVTRHVTMVTRHVTMVTRHVTMVTRHVTMVTRHVTMLTRHVTMVTRHVTMVTRGSTVYSSLLIPTS